MKNYFIRIPIDDKCDWTLTEKEKEKFIQIAKINRGSVGRYVAEMIKKELQEVHNAV